MSDRAPLGQPAASQGNVDDLLSQLRNYEDRSLLRFLMCGSVDDGKSTLIGRLLFESHKLYADQLAALEEDSRRFGTTGGDLDFALLMDGLAAEREQGITIDVAYRFFSTDRRHFIVADTPGHEQYTRNMVTGASNSECAVILVDASQGVVTQTRRHTYLVSLLGIRHVAVAINKMDLVDYDMHRFEEIEAACEDFAAEVELEAVTCIPVSGLRGDNVVAPSEHLQWFHGPTLMGYLETVEVDTDERLRDAPLRMPVQWVNRASADFRGFAGEIVAGSLGVGDPVTVVPSGRRSRIARVLTPDGDTESAGVGEAVTVTLEDEIDVSRGDILVADGAAPEVADQFEATIVWMDERPMFRGRNYLMRVGTRTVSATIGPLKHKVNVDTLEHVAATKLELNEIGVCELVLGQPIGFDSYHENRDMGGFILIDRITNDTVGAGMIHFALRRSHNIPFQPLSVDKLARARIMQQKPCVIWLTGLSGAGKSTIANLVEVELHRRGHYTYLLDGDNVRHGLNRDLGFTETDRVENIRRVAEVAKLMIDAGLIVLVSFISPFRSERQTARSLVGEGEFIEVFVDTPLAVAEERDPKGLYRKARQGKLENFTGISSPYEAPERPELRIDTTSLSAEQSVATVLALLEERGVISGG